MISKSLHNDYVVIVPARAGSKRIPHKNTTKLNGRPLIEHTFEFTSRLDDRIDQICTTNDTAVEEVARSFKRMQILKRPDHLAGDNTSDLEVIQHVLLNYDKPQHGLVIIYLRPTSPFRDHDELEAMIHMIETLQYSSIRAMRRAEGVHHPYWMFKNEGGLAHPFIEGIDLKSFFQSQLLPPALRLTGTYDLFFANNISHLGSLYGPKMGAFEVSHKTSVDIDSPEDLLYAEFLASTHNIMHGST